MSPCCNQTRVFKSYSPLELITETFRNRNISRWRPSRWRPSRWLCATNNNNNNNKKTNLIGYSRRNKHRVGEMMKAPCVHSLTTFMRLVSSVSMKQGLYGPVASLASSLVRGHPWPRPFLAPATFPIRQTTALTTLRTN